MTFHKFQKRPQKSTEVLVLFILFGLAICELTDARGSRLLGSDCRLRKGCQKRQLET